MAPNGSNPSDIPDEEGTVFELDDTNLLSHDRFAGLDSVDSGRGSSTALSLAFTARNSARLPVSLTKLPI